MDSQRVVIYSRAEELPERLLEGSFFHSRDFFVLSEQTPRLKPYMIVVHDNDDSVRAQMIALVRYKSSWFPPYLYIHCRILGEGIYRDNDKEPLFGTMLNKLTERLGSRMFYIEVSNLPQKMFAYGELRRQGYFPVRWMSIHNSLHSRQPEERVTPQTAHKIEVARQRGLQAKEVETDEEFRQYMKLLRSYHWLKPKRYIPHDDFFKGVQKSGNGRLYITTYRGHVVGCSAVVYSHDTTGTHTDKSHSTQPEQHDFHNNAYLWYAAFRRKSFAFLHPDVHTLWYAIKHSHQLGYDHIVFLDVGLPFKKNHFRDFILRFGGKPMSTYRWFRFSIKPLNSLLSWIYRD